MTSWNDPQGTPSHDEALPAAGQEHGQALRVLDEGDEPATNFSLNVPFAEIVGQHYSRRQMMQGSLQAAVVGLFAAGPGAALAASPGRSAQGRARPGFEGQPGFEPIPVYNGDEVSVATGYSAEPFLVVGEPILGPDVGNPAANTVEAFENCSGAEMEQRIGSHHDGMTYFPFGSDPNNHGVICINHEYIDARKLFPATGPDAWVSSGPRPADQIRKGIAAHGVSVVEIKRNKANGKWQITTESGLNRRVTAETPMAFSGPVRGSDLVKTRYSPDGTMTRGTINNCANGYTPWGTYLTCEENWASYFRAGTADNAARREFRRFGVGINSSRYGWDNPAINPLTGLPDEPTASPANPDPYTRFNATPTGADATQDYRNEPNCQGWNVEIDPFNPDSIPIKHTALGRYAHEGCVVGVPQEGQPLAFYSGDDAVSQYMYKFVTSGRYYQRTAGSHLLESGTLYAAKFNNDGTGEWLALDINDAKFRAAMDRAVANPRSVWPGGQYDGFDGFRDQADVLVNTRLAADVAGATPMDRPEWATVHPSTGEVYFSCTNNSTRGSDATTNTRPIPTVVDAANPRPSSAFGHIVRFRERGNRSAATSFTWDLFVLSGPQDDSLDLQGRPLDDSNIHASADGLWLDNRGILWIETDMGSGQQEAEINRFGNNQMLAANPYTGEIRRFFVGCRGQEVTGWADTPDGRTVFVNLQHPGESSESRPVLTSTYPDGPGSGGRGRSCTIVITRNDGGVVGV